MTVRVKMTIAEYIDKLLRPGTPSGSGVVRRKIVNLPRHFTLTEIIAEVVGRGYKLLIGSDQIVILTDRNLTLCN